MRAQHSFGSAGLTVMVIGPSGREDRFFPPGHGDISVGRDTSCSIALADSAISRRHLLLRLGEGGVVIEDISANGTFVNGQLLRRSALAMHPRSSIRLGQFELRCYDGVPQEPSTYDLEATEAPDAVGHQSLPPVMVADEHQEQRGDWRTRRPSVAPPMPSLPGTPAQAQAIAGQPRPEPPQAVASGDVSRVSADVRRKLHRSLVDHLDLLKLERSRLNPLLLRAKVELALKEICVAQSHLIPKGTDIDRLILELGNEAVGLGPLEELLADESVNEIMVVDPKTIYIERAGKMSLTTTHFTDIESLRSTLERIVMPLGRRIDESAPMLDARLPDGSRVNAVIPPLATRGPCITIRKFSTKPLGMHNLVEFGSVNKRMAAFLERSVQARKNIVVAGGTGSGKTTLLNILSASCSEEDRIITIEDSAELQLQQSHVVTLESRPANMEGKGAVTIRDLVKNAMRMRPDRIIVGECRGGEALDMLLAMNTGHDGSMTTTHANSPQETLRRLEALALMSGIDLPGAAIREQIAYAVDLVVHQTRFSDGSRRITSITEIAGLEDGQIETREIFGFRRTGTTKEGKVEGEFFATGYLPSYLTDFLALGIIRDGDTYL